MGSHRFQIHDSAANSRRSRKQRVLSKRARIHMGTLTARMRLALRRRVSRIARLCCDGVFRFLDRIPNRDVRQRSLRLMIMRTVNYIQERYLILPLEWLDQSKSGLMQCLEEQTRGSAYGPSIDGTQRAEVVQLPSVNLYRFDRGRVCGRSSSILLDDRVIIERTEGVDSRRCSFETGHIHRHGEHIALISRQPTEYLSRGIFLGGNGSFNYYHWVIEILPKLRYVAGLGEKYIDFPLLVSEDVATTATFAQSLAELAGDRTVVYLDVGRIYEVAELVYINSPNSCPFNLRPGNQVQVADFRIRASTIDFLRGRTKSAGDASQAGLRIFMARPTVRRCYNQEDVFDLLRARGFVRVSMEELTWIDQIDLMSRAQVIVGPSGAAWANLVFCAVGTKCISWIPSEFDEFAAYSTLASIAGVDLRYVTYPVGVSTTAEAYGADYRVDVSAISDALDVLSVPSGSQKPTRLPGATRGPEHGGTRRRGGPGM